MAYKPVGIDTETSLFPTRVMNALKSIFVSKSSLAQVASSGQYADLNGRPNIPSTPDSINAEPSGLSETTKAFLQSTYASLSSVNGKVSASDVDTKIAAAQAALISSSPATLDTLKELADAIGDDPNYAVNITAALGKRIQIWSAKTPFKAGQLVVNPSGQIVSANADFVSGDAYSSANWSNVPGALGSVTVTGTPSANKVLVAVSANEATWTAAKTIDTTSTPQAPSTAPSPGTGSSGASASDHVHPLPTLTQLQALGVPSSMAYQVFTASGSYTVPVAGVYELLCVGGGGAGGGGGSAAQTSGVSSQGAGGGGGSGVAAVRRVSLAAGTVLTISVAAASTGGTGGSASTGSTGNAGSTGGQGNPTQVTWSGGNSLGAPGGAAGSGSPANSSSHGAQGNAGQPYFQQGNFPGCGGYSGYGGTSPGPIAHVATGGGGGGAATATNGGGAGNGGTPINYQAAGGSSGASSTTAGISGTAALANSGGGGGGGGGGAPGGAGGSGGAGASGRFEIRQVA